MSTGQYVFKRSLSDCVHTFQVPACIEQVCFYSFDVIICLFACLCVAQRIRYECRWRWRIPKIKQLVLICLSLSTLCMMLISDIVELVYQADFMQHWSFYTSIFFDDLYFVWIVYYFGKKCFNAMGYHNLLKYYKISLGVLVGLFSSYYIYNLAQDPVSANHRICFDPWYTYSRVLVLLLEFALCVIGCCIHNKLNQKITQARSFSHEQTIQRLLKKNRKQMSILIILILIFLISEVVLLMEAIIFQVNHSLNCQFFSHNATANFFTTFPILVFGFYIPRFFTIWVFRYNKFYKTNKDKSKLDESIYAIQMALSRTNPLKSPTVLVEECTADNHTS